MWDIFFILQYGMTIINQMLTLSRNNISPRAIPVTRYNRSTINKVKDNKIYRIIDELDGRLNQISFNIYLGRPVKWFEYNIPMYYDA